jgi:hypothetical protein
MLYQREDDYPESVRVRMEAHRRSTAPLADFYSQRQLLVSVSAEGAPEEICERTFPVADALQPGFQADTRAVAHELSLAVGRKLRIWLADDHFQGCSPPRSFHRFTRPEHLGADLAEQFDPREISALGQGDLPGVLEGQEMIGGFIGVLANPASGDAAGLQQKIAFVGDPAD